MATYTDNYNLIKPSYAEIADVATINTNMNTIDDIMHSTQVSLAPAYDSTQTYNIDDVVMYELLMYKCKENGVTGTWNASKWERTTASECGDSGSGGTSVVPNPQGEPTDTLETIEIDGTVYDIAGSGGGGSARKLYKKLYNGNITSTGEVTLLESIENYDFIMIELAYLSGEGNPICGSTIADVPYLKSTYNNATSIWVDGGNNDRSAKIAFSNATTMKVNKASTADAIIGVYGFKLEASGGGGTDVEANPSGTATEELNKLRVDNTIYSIPEGSEVVVYGEASGNIAEFDDGSNKPMSKCKIDINAVQSGSGDPSPTNVRPISGFNGGNVNVIGENLFDASNGIQDKLLGRGTGSLTTNTSYMVSNFMPVEPLKSYYYKDFNIWYHTLYDANKNILSGILGSTNATQITIPDGNARYIRISCEKTKQNTAFLSETAITYSVSWQSQAGTVYGGNIDLVSGVLTVTHANIASYDGETLPSTWISDRDVYSVGGTPTTGAQVVYELATPLTYQLTPIQVNSLLGINNVWNDTNGETEVKYIRDLNTTVNQLVQHLTYGYGGTPSFNGNDGDVHIVLNSLNKKKGEFMWLNNQWTLIEGSGEVALKLYDNGVEGVAWSVTGGTKNTTNISLTVGSGTFTNYAITNTAVNVTNYSTLTVVCKYRDQNYTKVIDLTNVSGNKYISFLCVTDSNHNECAVGLTDTNSPSPTYRVDSRNGGTAECIMYSCTLE